HLTHSDGDDRADIVEDLLLPHRSKRGDREIRPIESLEEEGARPNLEVLVVLLEEVHRVVPEVEGAHAGAELPEHGGRSLLSFQQWAVADDRYEGADA